MQRTKISTPNAPAAIGPYNQAIRYGQFVYTSGQIALDPTTGELSGDDVQSQTHRVLQNLQAVLESAGTSLGQVSLPLRLTVQRLWRPRRVRSGSTSRSGELSSLECPRRRSERYSAIRPRSKSRSSRRWRITVRTSPRHWRRIYRSCPRSRP